MLQQIIEIKEEMHENFEVLKGVGYKGWMDIIITYPLFDEEFVYTDFFDNEIGDQLKGKAYHKRHKLYKDKNGKYIKHLGEKIYL